MADWIIRVEGKEYGPVNLGTLLDWKREGRVLPGNEARRADVDLWITAAEIPGLFDLAAAESSIRRLTHPPLQARRSFAQILAETLRIYGKGFVPFLGLTLLVALPSICAQLASSTLNPSPHMEWDLRTLIAGAFTFCMLPIFIAGIQILTAELSADRRPQMTSLLRDAFKFWPRVAMLCILVLALYLFWTVLPVGVILMIALGGPSVFFFFLALLVLAFQVWIVGRLFVNFLFWQQFAVLGESDAMKALRQSKELARSGRDLPWYRRPLWRGVFIASIWFAFMFAIYTGAEWQSLQRYFQQLTTIQDPQTLLQTLTTGSRVQSFNIVSFSLGLLQTLLRPLLGIAFVLLYFESKIDNAEG